MTNDSSKNENPYIAVVDPMGDKEIFKDKKIVSLTWALWIIITFIGLWILSILSSLETKTRSIESLQMVYIESLPENINEQEWTNEIVDSISGENTDTNAISPAPTITNAFAVFKQEKVYAEGDVVAVKFFGITGIITHKSVSGYRVLYKDHDHRLHEILLPAELLMKPIKGSTTPYTLIN